MSEPEPQKVFVKVDEDTDIDELTDRLIEALFDGTDADGASGTAGGR